MPNQFKNTISINFALLEISVWTLVIKHQQKVSSYGTH